MSELEIPGDGKRVWPSLGGGVCDFIERNLCFGPGDLRGEPAVLDAEKRWLIWRMYELYPKGHVMAGRRRFRRCAVSLPKGTAKTEMAAWLAAAELHPNAPVRFKSWDKKGQPIGRSVTDPFVVLVATSEEQSDELAYGALRAILGLSAISKDFDIGLERIMRKDGAGSAVSVAGTPNARDGARTTFQVFDETHRFTAQRLRDAHQTMTANLPKRKGADPWGLEITTAPEPGTGSIAESTMEYARQVASAKVRDSALFFFHRQADEDNDFSTEALQRAGVIQARGPMAEWADIDGIVGLFQDPTRERNYLRRVYGNQLVRGESQAFDVEKFKTLVRADNPAKPGDLITLGFDGGLFDDSTAIVATHVETGYQWIAGLWEKPVHQDSEAPPWQVPTHEVDAVMCGLFLMFTVWRLYADPPHWDSWIAKWRGQFGDERVIDWWTNRIKQMAYALQAFVTAIAEKMLSHSGDASYVSHVGNARKQDLHIRDEQGIPLWWIRKERPDSPHKIDVAMAGVLSWEARTDAIASGVSLQSVYATRGVRTLGE